MQSIMSESFVRGLLYKIIVEVLDVIDRRAEDEKSWEQHVNEETSDAQLEYVRGEPQGNERPSANYNKAEEIELITKIVDDLRDIRIGDSRYVLPPSLLAVERQVKRAACNVDDAPLTNPTTDVEIERTTRGQGDIHQIVHTAILESPAELTEEAKIIQRKKEGETINEGANVSVGLLQQLIGDLENKEVSTRSEDEAVSNPVSKEHIVIWEETEERFVKVVESNVSDAHESTTGSLRGNELIGRYRVDELKHDEELRSHSSQHVASLKEIDLDQVPIKKRRSNSLSSLKSFRDDGNATVDQILPIDDAEKRRTFNETTAKKKKKRAFGNQLRKLFRAAFGRRKN
ncbi:hypothetical protein PUN28_017300 [Cardiocondyla obscurior]|uniref:Uncharacterized protein n=1 Tax=Cardiocondyla obscurior TaxID=286306 RepID=A0AAW2ER20_9HYME